MNLDLILENIRLGHIEKLLTEATSDLEVVRGQRLINESIMQLHGILMQEVEAQKPSGGNGAAIATGLGLGAVLAAPTLIGGAIGNSIHGDDGTDPVTGFITDPQAHNDDEYDMTGAAIGAALTTPVLAAGAAGLGAAGLGAGARHLFRRR